MIRAAGCRTKMKRSKSSDPDIVARLAAHAEQWSHVLRFVMRRNPGWIGKNIREHMPAAERRVYRALMDHRHAMTTARALSEMGARQ